LVVHLPSSTTFQAEPGQLARSRHPHGTRESPLTAASFRTWRGSWLPAAWDPDVFTTYPGQPHKAYPRAGIRPRYSGLRVTGHRYLPV